MDKVLELVPIKQMGHYRHNILGKVIGELFAFKFDQPLQT